LRGLCRAFNKSPSPVWTPCFPGRDNMVSSRTLSQHEHLLATALELDDPILATDELGHLVFINRAAAELFDIDLAHATDRRLSNLVRCDGLIDLVRTVSGGDEQRRSRDLAICDPGVGTIWYRVTARRLELDGRAAGVVCVLHDIDAKVNLEQRTAQFVAAISHEMKTPLAGIRAFVELLADDEAEDEPTRREFLDVISAQANRLQQLVDNLLHLARLEAGVARVNKQNCSLNELLSEALRAVEGAADRQNITLRREFSPEDLQVPVDRDLTIEAAVHLLGNAVKLAPRGGLITLRSRAAGNEAQFEIEGDGAPLTGEERRRVFEKFYRLRPNQGLAVGSGLGMPLSRYVVEQVHGGSVEVAGVKLHSATRSGNLFQVFLPCTAGSRSGANENTDEQFATSEDIR
jgi:two-component system, OmpR family, phosphate regulon sensor histidine kinase PhoR